uniref:(northern house mosquito) hypothetical protein n=1 Tax=Culex pipiens TaxID=7175 RepID=A0A8D8MPB2_CULPI
MPSWRVRRGSRRRQRRRQPRKASAKVPRTTTCTPRRTDTTVRRTWCWKVPKGETRPSDPRLTIASTLCSGSTGRRWRSHPNTTETTSRFRRTSMTTRRNLRRSSSSSRLIRIRVRGQ